MLLCLVASYHQLNEHRFAVVCGCAPLNEGEQASVVWLEVPDPWNLCVCRRERMGTNGSKRRCQVSLDCTSGVLIKGQGVSNAFCQGSNIADGEKLKHLGAKGCQGCFIKLIVGKFPYAV